MFQENAEEHQHKLAVDLHIQIPIGIMFISNMMNCMICNPEVPIGKLHA